MHDLPSRTFSRRLSLLASIGLAILLGAGTAWYKGHRTATTAIASGRRRPDVVVILTDDMGFAHGAAPHSCRSRAAGRGKAAPSGTLCCADRARSRVD